MTRMFLPSLLPMQHANFLPTSKISSLIYKMRTISSVVKQPLHLLPILISSSLSNLDKIGNKHHPIHQPHLTILHLLTMVEEVVDVEAEEIEMADVEGVGAEADDKIIEEEEINKVDTINRIAMILHSIVEHMVPALMVVVCARPLHRATS